MRGSDAGESLRLGFDHGAEVVVAPRALLLQVLPDPDEVFFQDRFVQKASPRSDACGRVCIQPA